MNTTEENMHQASRKNRFEVLDIALQAAGTDRLYHYRVAYGSAKEVEVHLRLLAGVGVVEQSRTGEAIELFDRVRAMTWRLLHPRP